MRVYFCGHRNWTNEAYIREELERLPPDTVVLHSGSSTIGRVVGPLARQLGLPVLVFHPDWARYGKEAETKRNQEVIREGKPDRVVAFSSSMRGHGDTRDMVEQARAAGIEVCIVAGTEELRDVEERLPLERS